MPIYETLLENILFVISIAVTLRSPPHREIKPELMPETSAANNALITAMPKAGTAPKAVQANITMIFEKPGFIPIGRGKSAINSLSIKDRLSASAAIIPVTAIRKFLFLFFLLLISIGYDVGGVIAFPRKS